MQTLTQDARLASLSPQKRAALYHLLAKRQQAPSHAVTRYDGDRNPPLSFAQERFYAIDRWTQAGAAYNIPIAMRVRGAVSLEALKRSLDGIVHRHEALRTTLRPVDGKPVQVVLPPQPVGVSVVDLRGVARGERESRALALASEEAGRGFDLSRDVMLRAVMYRLNEADSILLFVTHHAAFDGSVEIFLRELTLFYRAYSRGRAPGLEGLPVQYVDFAAWQRRRVQGGLAQRQLGYWKKQLGGGLPVLELPTDRPRPPVPTFRGQRRWFGFPADLSGALRSLAQENGVSLFVMGLAGFQALLHRYTGQTDIAVGAPMADRPCPRVEDLIGSFTNTVILRGDLSGEPTFRELLERVQAVVLGAQDNKDVPFERVLEAVEPRKSLGQRPVFETMFTFQSNAVSAGVLDRDAGVSIEPAPIDPGTSRFDLLTAVWEQGDALAGMVEFNTDLFDPGTIDRFIGHFQTLLESAADDPDQPVGRLGMLTPGEREELAAISSPPETQCPPGLLHELFEKQARVRGRQQAVVTGDGKEISYAELDRVSRYWAGRLRERGTSRNELVAVVMDKGWEQVAAVLAVLRAGAGYLPLDPGLPRERLEHLIEHAGVKLALTQSWVEERVSLPEHVERFAVDEPVEEDASVEDDDRSIASGAESSDLAYVIFTSGSTGLPKGVMMDHRGVVNTVLDINRRFGVGCEDRVLALSSLSFDLSVWDVFGTLAAGGTIVIPDAERIREPGHWAQLMARERVTVWNSVPALMELLVESRVEPEAGESLRLVMLSGDWIPLRIPDEIRSRFHGARVVSLGGATEAAIWSIFYPIDRVDPRWKSIPYGRPLTNQRVYVFDEGLRYCPVRVPGELYIGGVGVAQGYWRDEERTGAAFVTHPETGERLYRTGDLGCYTPEGQIEFLGRKDHQVKIRGYRVELGEIQVTLGQHPSVKEALVVARGDRSSEKTLVAYYIPDPQRPPTAEQLRGFLGEKLPGYMVPSGFVELDAFPLTANGKIDRAALPAPGIPGRGSGEREFVAPRDDLERRLAGLWEEVLEVERVSVEDDFFELGGNSFRVVRLLAKIDEAFAVDLPLSEMIQQTTVRRQAEALRTRGQGSSGASLVTIQRGTPGTPGGPGSPGRRPWFFVHPAGGSVFCYRDLARRIGADQPFYGLQARGLDGREATHPGYRDDGGGLSGRGAWVPG